MELAGVQHPHDLLEAYRTHEARDASTDQSNVPASAQSNAPSTELSDLRTRFLSDAVYRRRATHLANLQTKAGGPAHTYLFSAEPLGPHYGAFHGSERFYAFGQLTLLDIDTPEHRATRDALIGAWRGSLWMVIPVGLPTTWTIPRVPARGRSAERRPLWMNRRCMCCPGGIRPREEGDAEHPRDQRFLVFFCCGGVQAPRCNWQRE